MCIFVCLCVYVHMIHRHSHSTNLYVCIYIYIYMCVYMCLFCFFLFNAMRAGIAVHVWNYRLIIIYISYFVPSLISSYVWRGSIYEQQMLMITIGFSNVCILDAVVRVYGLCVWRDLFFIMITRAAITVLVWKWFVAMFCRYSSHKYLYAGCSRVLIDIHIEPEHVEYCLWYRAIGDWWLESFRRPSYIQLMIINCHIVSSNRKDT